jgi:hypothetical protein
MHIGRAPSPPKEIVYLRITLMKCGVGSVIGTGSFEEIIYDQGLEVRWRNISEDVRAKYEKKILQI